MAAVEQISLFDGEQVLTTEPNALERSTAASQQAGFVYQFHRAIEALFDLKPGQMLGIEVIDDFHVEGAGKPERLVQVKLHRPRSALTDGAPDLWKTLGIWARAVADGSLDLGSVRELCLLTTATLPQDSIGALIAEGRPAEEIVVRLLAVPRSRTKSLARDFQCVHDLDPDDIRVLAARLVIRAEDTPLAGINALIEARLRASGFHAETLAEAREALIGWVEGRMVPALAAGHGPVITEEEFHLALTNLRDRFVRDFLPARFADPSTIPVAEYAGQKDSVFVRQLEAIDAPQTMVNRAIRDYLRAVKERSAWIDRIDILPDRLAAYDRELIERWEPLHEACCEECADGDEEAQRSARRHHYRTVSQLHIPIDPRWQYSYLMTGSYHELANALRVGWHPRFTERLAATAPKSGISVGGKTETVTSVAVPVLSGRDG